MKVCEISALLRHSGWFNLYIQEGPLMNKHKAQTMESEHKKMIHNKPWNEERWVQAQMNEGS